MPPSRDPWPFEDATNTAVFTVAEVLSGEKPVLHVCHDVSDGGWQFLTGEELDLGQAKLVCLAEIIDRDPHAGRPALGSSAERRFGEQHGLERLTTARWEADEVDAWEVTSVACFLLAGDGVYRAPDESGALYMVLREPKVLPRGD